MNIVCIPYRPDTPERMANFARTNLQWKGWSVITADSDGEDFGRSQAVNSAVAQAGDWEVLVVADADLLLEDVEQAVEALELARERRGYVMCYSTFYYLNEGMSVRVRDGREPTPAQAYYSLTELWIGMFAIHASAFYEIGGFDEAFTSWGGEDGRFLAGLDEHGTYKGRVPGAVYHLNHPKVPSNWSS